MTHRIRLLDGRASVCLDDVETPLPRERCVVSDDAIVHWQLAPGAPVCGASGRVQITASLAGVTCLECRTRT